MIEGIPRLSVLIITYKQEVLIKRAIDSLLAQKDYIYEICVSDDCSPDNTWEVLLDYDRQYPGLFKLNRNEPNLGIFANLEKTWTICTGDLVYGLAGDDECPQGWLKTVIDFVLENKLDYKNDYFSVYGDYEARYPKGESFVFSNSAINTGIDPVRLSFRGIIGNRSAVSSRKVVQSYKVVSQGKSHIAESAQDRQLPFFSKKVYYIPKVGNIYYARVGISFNYGSDIRKEREDIETYAMKVLEENGYKFSNSDRAFIQLLDEMSKSYRLKSFSHTLKLLKLRFLSFDHNVSFRAFRFKRYLFALLMRLPHSRNLRMRV